MVLQACGEIRVVFLVLIEPSGFRQGAEAWEEHVFGLLSGGDVFGPELCLCAEHVVGCFGGKSFRDRVERIDFFDADVAADGEWLVGLVFALIFVEVVTEP